jgi:hypothetical protein
MNATQLVAYLNAIRVGEMDGIQLKLEEARKACHDIGQEGLADKLVEAEHALQQADVQTFRKRMETVIARLGHAK